ncbi:MULTISPECIES: lycopene cyclase domain-containing protein [unclassified Microbacterium]|uniref:lycopene cyclase domain-containing protein n=1 Tax=unclassified Microbacterium TaxID=2609290 RepID=UPI00214B6CED|nr:MULTISPECIES: lycopene cyclase domain-containing protein [unclassified Microbacterium]MCR2784485.1 lycopene cyclase domain-containing protein [Microbacterium sp. zg.B96]WIM14703.1 lycopene cyclase domain-containing protein [Microbacterium sp. zg-B96]
MTYAWVILPFALVTLAVTGASAVRPHFGSRMIASAVAAAVLVVLTAVFDNAMIAADLFTYPEDDITGIRIGLAPIEDFSYPVCAAFLVPAVWTLLTPRSRA